MVAVKNSCQQNKQISISITKISKTSQNVSQDIPFYPKIKQNPENIFALLNLSIESNSRIFIPFANTALLGLNY